MLTEFYLVFINVLPYHKAIQHWRSPYFRKCLVFQNIIVKWLSDHDVVLVDSNIIPQRRKPVRRLIHIWSKADIPAMEKEIKNLHPIFIILIRLLHLSSPCGWTSRENAMRSSILMYHLNIPQHGSVSHGATGTCADVAAERSESTQEPSVLNVQVTGIASAHCRWKTRKPAKNA